MKQYKVIRQQGTHPQYRRQRKINSTLLLSSLAGGALFGGTIGNFFFGPVGTVPGAIIGAIVGSVASEKECRRLF